MKVVFISGEFPPDVSGVGDYTYRLAESLGALNHDIFVVTHAAHDASDDLETSSLKTIRLISQWDFSFPGKIIKFARPIEADICHILYHSGSYGWHLAVNLLPFFFKKDIRKMPVVTTYHEFAAPFKKMGLLPMLACSDRNVVTNDRDYKKLRWLAGMGNLTYVPLGPNILKVPKTLEELNATRCRYGLQKEDIVLVRFGFLSEIVAEELAPIFQAVQNITKEGRFSIKLLMVGKEMSQAAESLKDKASKMGIAGRIIFAGEKSTEEISSLLQIADVGIAPYPDGVSERRGAFLALIEHGLPVITTRGRHFPAKLKEKENVLCVDKNESYEEWQRAITGLLAHSELREKIAQNADVLAGEYRWDKIARQYEVIYQDLLERKSPK